MEGNVLIELIALINLVNDDFLIFQFQWNRVDVWSDLNNK